MGSGVTTSKNREKEERKKAMALEECHKTVKERASNKLSIQMGIDVADKEAQWRH